MSRNESKASYMRLVDCIKKREFPILVVGPPGSGKTHAIRKALEEVGVAYWYTELSEVKINKPISKDYVIHTVLYRYGDLDNLYYQKGVIIETCMGGVEKRLKECQLIKFTGGLKEKQIDLFRFIGRIFYKKLKIGDIEVKDQKMYYREKKELQPSKVKEMQPSKVKEMQPSKVKEMQPSKVKEMQPSKVKEMQPSKVKEQSKEVYKSRGRYIIESEDMEEQSIEMLEKETERESSDSMTITSFSSNEEIMTEHSKAIKELKRVFEEKKDERPEGAEYYYSFEMGPVEGYLYENFLHFVQLEDLATVYECLSLIDMDKSFISCFIGSIVQSKIPEKYKFRSFNFYKKEEKDKQIDRKAWQYKLNT
ncbi:hypothetical protein GINT2_001571 [Glugoides intestinalis]